MLQPQQAENQQQLQDLFKNESDTDSASPKALDENRAPRPSTDESNDVEYDKNNEIEH